MIVKNEEKYLEECLKSVENVVNEIIIVDTGSTDNTLEIAKRYNAKLFFFKWINDFAAARNYALKQCMGKWILYLDADERLNKESINELFEIIKTKNNTAVFCGVISKDGKGSTSNLMSYVRLFSNNPNIKFTGAVHEQIAPSLKLCGYNFIYSGIKIIHEGYIISDEELNYKAKRNLDILLIDYAKEQTGYKAYHLGVSYVVLNRFDKAITYFIEAVKDNTLEPNHLSHCYRYLAAYELNITKNLDRALFFALEGLKHNNKQPLLNVVISSIYLYKGDFKESEKYCRLAYNYNKDLMQSKTAFFDILVEEKAILQHIINIAALTANKSLFDDFYLKLKIDEIELNWQNLFSFFNSIINNLNVPKNLLNNLKTFFKLEYLDSALVFLKSYENINLRIDILQELNLIFDNKSGIFYLLGQSYLEVGNAETAVVYYHQYYNSNKNDPNVINILITLLFKLNKLKELNNLLSEAVDVFKSEPEIYNKINILKEKLENLTK